MTQFKRSDFVVGFLVMTVLFGLIYQGFYSLASFQDVAHQINFG